MSTGLGFVLLVASITAYAIVNAVEISVVAANRIRVRHLAEQGSRPAQSLRRLQESQDRFFAAIVLLQNAAVVVSGTVGSLVASDLAAEAGFSRGVGVVVAVGLVSLATTLFGELTPKVLAAQASDRFALAVALPLEALTSAVRPLVVVLGWVPQLLGRVLHLRLEAGTAVTEAELRMLIGESAKLGSVDEAEAALLNRVFHFGDRRVHEAMIPRTEAVWLAEDATVADFYRVFREAPHSRFPVYRGNPDNVVGIVGIKDVLRRLATGELGPESSIKTLIRPAFFVPETKLVGELFREMQATGSQMAVAVDEYGGTAGIITLEQLLEEMVGNVRDELGLAEEEFQQIDERTLEIDGSLSIGEARDELGLAIPEGDYDTVAGFVLSQLGHIPEEGESLTFDNHRLTVTEMIGPKIETVRVTRA